MSYIVLSYPFSQTTWLSELFNKMGNPCLHEKSVDFSSLEEFKEFFDGYEGGIVDTALINIHHNLKDYKLALIVNDISEVRRSLTKRGFPETIGDYQIEFMEGALHDKNIYKIEKKDLTDSLKVKGLCEYLGIAFVEEIFDGYKDRWITTDIWEFTKKMINSNKDHSWLLNKEGKRICH